MHQDSYEAVLARKAQNATACGLTVVPELHPKLFGYQREAVEWALRLGRAALFFDCGLGKTPMQVIWAQAVAEATGKPVLILAPLAVSLQTVREGAKFDVPITYCEDQSQVVAGVYVTNYERVARFDHGLFGGVVLDESSILKSYSGPTKRALCEAWAQTPFRLCCSATPAPNDHMELGNHAEFLGVMTSHEMLARWFLPDTSTAGNYRLKGHAVVPFWDWVTSWARCAGKPSDVGHSDDGFVLPELHVHEHVVDVDQLDDRGDQLFRMPEMSATSFHREKRRTAADRARAVAATVRAEAAEQWLIWTDTDYEADALTECLPEAVDVRGGATARAKEKALLDFADGAIRVLVTKPKLAGMGMNFQQCARVAFVGPSFSFEQYYQAVRRVWRFGQTRPVHGHVFMGASEAAVWAVVRRKADGHETMKQEMFAAARRAVMRESRTLSYQPRHRAQLPGWIRTA
jgi:hypothetical protein